MYSLLAISLCFSLAIAAPSADLITTLPGLSQLPSFKQYSGYLSATATKHLHYWFVESQTDPANDPIVLWLNGGPGCSSLDGFLSENGPFHVNDDGSTLYVNPHSWNKIANVLYLESPAGVGYSYDDNQDYSTDDDKVSLHNYQALVDFFKKFPEFVKNPFFVTGESYGGIYVPTLSVRIAEGSFKMNFKGFAVGNGLSSSVLNDKSLIFFAYYHGLFGEVLRKEVATSCCNGGWSRQECDFTTPGDCQDMVEEVFQYVYDSGLNTYALYRDCYGGQDGTTERYRRDMNLLFKSLSPHRRQMVLGRKLKVGEVPPCVNVTASTNWLNRPDVRTALHIPPSLPTWAICSDTLQYKTLYGNMTSQYDQLLKNPDLRALVYNGDVDMACNFLGDEWFVDDLKRPITRSRAPWYVNGQVAGFAKTFDRIVYTTIRGAGHMVPQWAPMYAYRMFDNFINNKPFV